MKKSFFSRREFLGAASRAGIVAGISISAGRAFGQAAPDANNIPAAEIIPYTQEPLPYSYQALEPALDARTMEIHFTKHAAGYTKNLAEALIAERVDTDKTNLEQLLAGISRYSTKMRNNAGGHYNHSLFWQLMSPAGKNTGPSPALLSAIQKDFGSLDSMKERFSEAGKTRFGSGWAWLVLQPDKKLSVTSTPNQDNPLMDDHDGKGQPLMGLDVWEHAYYLRYQNRRPDYIQAWWTVLNWDFVNKRFARLS